MSDNDTISEATRTALLTLLEVLPRLNFGEDFMKRLRAFHEIGGATSVLRPQMDLILAVSKQNQRVSERYGYVQLGDAAAKVTRAAQAVVQTYT